MPLRWLLAVALTVPAISDAQCRVWRIERQASAIRLASSLLENGQTEVLSPDGTSLVSVVVVTGEGQSADMVSPSTSSRLITRCVSDTLRVLVQRGDQPAREVMRLAQRDLAGLRVGVHVIGADGVKARWRIDGWERAAVDPGPVLDLFQGRVPIPANGHIVVTVVERAPSGDDAVLSGTADLRWEDGYPLLTMQATRPWRAVVDLAAATTIVRRGALDPNVTLRDATMRQVSSAGVQSLSLAGDGAGGQVTGFHNATIPTLSFGTVQLSALDVLVLDALPTVGGAPLDAILGLDVLRRAARTRLTREGDAWTLALGRTLPPVGHAASAEFALRSVGALVGVVAHIDDVETFLILDSGSPHTVLSTAIARDARLATTPVRGPAPRGLDGRPLTMSQATAGTVELGAVTLRNVAVRIADLPVLAKLGQDHVGLLGGDILSQFAVIEVNFVDERLRLFAPAAPKR